MSEYCLIIKNEELQKKNRPVNILAINFALLIEGYRFSELLITVDV